MKKLCRMFGILEHNSSVIASYVAQSQLPIRFAKRNRAFNVAVESKT